MLRAISLEVLVQTNLDFATCWDRKEVKYLGDIPVNLLSVEDLITMKEYANREQDKKDIINLKKLYKRD